MNTTIRLCAILLPPVFLLLVYSGVATAKVVEYELSIDYTTVHFSGKPARAMVVNGTYPGPVLRFTEGDTARIHVTNHMDVDSSVHWHGLLLPPDQDGVPYLSNLPIAPGETFTYEFRLRHAGTYWYHSHTDLQEQSGVHGGIVITPRDAEPSSLREAVLVLQDWTDENPEQVLRNLKKDGDYYAMKKNTVISIAGYLRRGAMRNWWWSRWIRMGGMDLSDVGYDAFLVNGKREQHLFQDAKPGEQVRLRLINAGASTYFLLHSADLKTQVVGADGLDVAPVRVDEILHAVAETYDLLVTLPEQGAAELRVSAQDGSGYASVFLGKGERRYAEPMPRPDLYSGHDMHGGGHGMSQDMDHDMGHGGDRSGGGHGMGHDGDHSHDGHQMHRGGGDGAPQGPRRLAYTDLRTLNADPYIGDGPVREIPLTLTGNMETYNWSFDDTPLSQADKILIKRGETVRFNFINETMMHHPLHLHGHFFRVLDGRGGGPFKHTVDVPPMGTVSIEFLANEEKDWFFHCHNLYHAKTGMARVIRYDDYGGDPRLEAAARFSKDMADTDYYGAADLRIMNDYASLSARTSNTRHEWELDAETLDYDEWRGGAAYLFSASRWLQFMVGVEAESDEDTHYRFGLRYTLPMLVDLDVFVTNEGEVDVALETEFQLGARTQLHIEWESTDEYHAGLEYRFNQRFSIEAGWTDTIDASIGAKLRF